MSRAFRILTGGNQLVSLPLPWFSTQKIEEQRRKDLANPCTGEEWGHRHRIKIQTHTQNKEQMLTRASQVTFVKKIYIKYYFILENVVEWAILLKCLQSRCNSESYTFLFSFSLIWKVDAVKKKIISKGLVKSVYPRWMSSYLLVVFQD